MLKLPTTKCERKQTESAAGRKKKIGGRWRASHIFDPDGELGRRPQFAATRISNPEREIERREPSVGGLKHCGKGILRKEETKLE